MDARDKPEHDGTGATKKIASFAAYLLIALPANMAMAADWQAPAQVAALNQNLSVPQATSITITQNVPQSNYFKVTYQDVAKEVETQLVAQGVETKARATTNPSNDPVVYGADHPLKLVLHALQVDPKTHQWQAQAYVIAGGQTETVKPVAGRYEGLVAVPVLKHQVGSHDVIEASDLDTMDVASRNIRKDTITDGVQLIGKSPRSTISAQRAVRLTEISAPVVIKKGDIVDMSYSTQYVHIKTTGIALEDGELGMPVRIKNEKSEKAVTARATGTGTAEVNMDSGS
jgi:flagella basal body P-ring formation protein FlgA